MKNFKLWPLASKFITKKNSSDLKLLRTRVNYLTPTFLKLLPFMSHENDIYRNAFNKDIYVGAKCCGASCFILKGMLDIKFPEDYESNFIGRKEHSDEHIDTHIYLDVVCKGTRNHLVCDPAAHQFWYNKIDVSTLPEIMVATPEDWNELCKKYYRTDELPWFVKGSSHGEAMISGDKFLRDIENNDLKKISLGEKKNYHSGIEQLIESKTWKQFINEDIELNIEKDGKKSSDVDIKNKTPKKIK